MSTESRVEDFDLTELPTSEKILAVNWYGDINSRIEEFYDENGKVLAADKVEQLVSAFASGLLNAAF